MWQCMDLSNTMSLQTIFYLFLFLHLTLSLEQTCSDDNTGCNLACNSTFCDQKCQIPSCKMRCSGTLVCNQNCYNGDCPLMECLDSEHCSANCDGGNCIKMSCQARSICALTCDKLPCSMVCSAAYCEVKCIGGGCNITFVANSMGKVDCPGGNCRIKCPRLGKCRIGMCEANSCSVSYYAAPTETSAMSNTRNTTNTNRPSAAVVGAPQYLNLFTCIAIYIAIFH